MGAGDRRDEVAEVLAEASAAELAALSVEADRPIDGGEVDVLAEGEELIAELAVVAEGVAAIIEVGDEPIELVGPEVAEADDPIGLFASGAVVGLDLVDADVIGEADAVDVREDGAVRDHVDEGALADQEVSEVDAGG